MIYPLHYFSVRNQSIHINSIPVLFIHMIAGNNRGVFLSKLDCKGRIAFQVY
jgi:hypothetical protein